MRNLSNLRFNRDARLVAMRPRKESKCKRSGDVDQVPLLAPSQSTLNIWPEGHGQKQEGRRREPGRRALEVGLFEGELLPWIKKAVLRGVGDSGDDADAGSAQRKYKNVRLQGATPPRLYEQTGCRGRVGHQGWGGGGGEREEGALAGILVWPVLRRKNPRPSLGATSSWSFGLVSLSFRIATVCDTTSFPDLSDST
ncbi:hypothetical protein GQ53DRAFT_380181 [Thozetella sp. PMI_491]|nr:hypothetical protein GQ53DRAFT_380181 [Thozetella sp. PMI_491]